jgi:hypothetical protein
MIKESFLLSFDFPLLTCLPFLFQAPVTSSTHPPVFNL